MHEEQMAEGEENEVDEFERRFLVLFIDPDVQRGPYKHIVQGYFDGPGNPRVRIIDDKVAVLTRKTGRGRARREKNRRTDLDTARFLLDSTYFTLTKHRYVRDGWEIDFFQNELTGLVLAEFETSTPDQEVVLPPFIREAIEVTETLTNRHLAQIAYDLREGGSGGPVRDALPERKPRIVITGGPCSGKSSIMDELRKEMRDVLQCVPEVATIVIERVGAKPPFGDPVAMREFQRTIYGVQRGFEKVSNRQAIRDGKRGLLLDRGTVDGAAYMEKGLADLASTCQTTAADEFARYAGVVCLEVPPKEIYEANKGNNPARSETYEQAAALGARIAEVWSGHPRFVLIRNGSSWEEKRAAARAAIMSLLDG